MSLPNLFLIAAPRSGSTQLARWLDTHPEVSLSGVKEPNHFSAHEFPPNYVAQTHLDDVPPTGPPPRRAQFAVFRDRAAYERLFEPLTSRWRLDASTSYLACPEAPSAIQQAIPDAKVILLTRDPIDRAVSHYRLSLRTGRTQASLAEEIERELAGDLPLAARYLIRPSQQTVGVDRVRAAFHPGAILHLTFEEVSAAPDLTMCRVANFLTIPNIFDLSVTARNAAALPRFQNLNAWALHSGAKTLARRIVPTRLRPLARALWFHQSTAPISTADLTHLQSLLRAP